MWKHKRTKIKLTESKIDGFLSQNSVKKSGEHCIEKKRTLTLQATTNTLIYQDWEQALEQLHQNINTKDQPASGIDLGLFLL